MELPHKDLMQRLAPTIAFVAPLILLVALAGYLRFQAENRPILFEVDVPQTISVPEGSPVAIMEITLRLENRSDEAIDLIVANDCSIFRWFLLDRSGSFVQSQVMSECGETAVAETIGAKSTLVRTTTITMDGSRLLPGSRYDLMLRFWGYEARERFHVTD